MSKRRKIGIGVGLAVLIFSLAGLAIASTRSTGTEVRTQVVGQRDLVAVVTASGYLQPKRKVDISADISGRVVELAVEEGQWVEQGDLLLRIDPTTYQAAVGRAEAAVAQAQAEEAQARASYLQSQSAANRAEQLAAGDNLISAQELERARTEEAVASARLEAARYGIAQARAALSEARDMLAKTTITAPMTGRVTRLNIEQGETAIVGTMNNPGSLLLTIADLSEMEARVEVDETDVPRITLGDSATIQVDAFPNSDFAGRVTQIANSAVQPTDAAGTMGGGATLESIDFEVIITLTNPPDGLRPDLSATADIITETRENALAVPILAVTVRDPEGKQLDAFAGDEDGEEDAAAASIEAAQREAAEVEGVFVVREGKAEFVPVEIGIAGEQYFEVEDGLSGGETVVSGTFQTIRELEDGDPVQFEEPESAEAGESPDSAEGT